MADCTTAMRLQPENIKALIRRGVALFQSERLEMALSDFDLAISMLSKSASGAGCVRFCLHVVPVVVILVHFKFFC